ncbi:MAG: L-ribulose-5-phosphate 4-epimerase AraD [Planctomycetota bacterium]|jgi:L-ribulose-5-phosphate 4-epimerase|nr:L-ribulose-5-phosphate 4-epimerase AraD [Planctomycetota bacterium]
MECQQLREQVYEANMELKRQGLVLHTWGNASGIDRERGLIAIKPSGVAYADLTPASMVLVDLDNQVVDGTLKPSSDTRTHTLLYREFASIGGVVHTHSTYATAWSQARRELPCYGTTHADYAHGAVPCTAVLTPEACARDYEEETGVQIRDAFAGLDPVAMPMVLVGGHAPFTWGKDVHAAVYHAGVLEEVARMATITEQVNAQAVPLPAHIVDKHYMRKHGPAASYGQG